MQQDNRERKRAWQSEQRPKACDAFPILEADLKDRFEYVSVSIGRNW